MIHDLVDLRLSDLLALLAAEDPAPGCGSAAAVTGAMAAALVTMAARHSRESWPEAAGVAAQARALEARCAELAQADAEAFAGAVAALECGSGVELPLERAAAVPLELAEAAVDIAALAALTAERCDGTFRADAAAAAVLAEAVARVAAALVAANLTVSEGDERLGRARSLEEAASRAASRALDAGP